MVMAPEYSLMIFTVTLSIVIAFIPIFRYFSFMKKGRVHGYASNDSRSEIELITGFKKIKGSLQQ